MHPSRLLFQGQLWDKRLGKEICAGVEGHHIFLGTKLHALRYAAKCGKCTAHEAFAHYFRLPRGGEKLPRFLFHYAFA